MKRRVAITGMGMLSPLGNTVKESFENAKLGKNGIDFITSFDTSDMKVKIAAELKNFDIEKYMDKKAARKMARFTQLAVIASREAVQSSGLEITDENASRIGVSIASGIGGLDVTMEEHGKGLKKGFDRVSPFFIPMAITNMASGAVAIEHKLHGMCTCAVTACASATNAIGDSFRYIRDGYADVMLCGGSESCITTLGIGGFTSMKALCESNDPNRASIPFDKERSGFIMGEGAGVLVLEEYEQALSRGATILAEIVGYGSTCDAYHITAPSSTGEWAGKSMLYAIEDAGIELSKVDYINAHGTSTPMNDKLETKAIKNTFGDHAYNLLISSTKSMTGHLLGGSGAIEAILTINMLRESIVLPTINYKVADEECDLDIVPNKARDKDIKYALSNSFGFGGHNASILLKKA